MGIYIEGMDMPKDCPMCPLSHWNKLDILTGCELVWRYVPDSEVDYWQSNTRPEWCPLVEVPLKFDQGKQGSYQLKPDGNFGYQPVNKYTTLPSPPTTGSNIISPQNNTNYKKMENLVTKQDALEALQGIFDNCEEIDNHLPEEERSGYKMYPDYNVVWLYLTAPEKHGKWVIHFKDEEPHGTQCSCCGFVWSEEIAAVKLSPIFSRIYTPYCPNCGAKMESEDEE